MAFLRKYLKKYRWLLIRVLVLATVNQVFSLLDPWLFGRVTDGYITNIDDYTAQEFLTWLAILLGAMVGVAMISRLAKNFQDYYTNVMTQKIGMTLYTDAVRHAFSLPFAVFEDQSSGQLLNKLNKAKQDIQTFLQSLIGVLFVSVVGLLFVIVYALTVHRGVALFYVALIPIMGVTMYLMSSKIRHAQSTIVKESSALAGATTETIRNVSLIKSLWLEAQEMQRLDRTHDKILDLELTKVKILRTIEFRQGTLINGMRICLIAFMTWLIFTGTLSVGQFMTLFFYSFYVFTPLRQSGQVIKAFQEARASHEILQEIIALEPEKQASDPLTIDHIQGLRFDDVSFAYGDKQVLDGISFDLTPGKTIAFVWPSWWGKSTLLKLLVGLYPPSAWAVMVNDHSLQSLERSSYKQQLWLVTQDTQLFAGTIRENLQFVRPGATDDEMMAVLGQARIDELVTKNKAWLETQIGEWGLKLSGWQKQRLAIARALLRDPRVVIFDEATSALDSLVEKEISDTIHTISREREWLMTVLVAHRLSTVIHADVIYVLRDGRIVESGSHHDLVAQDGLYRALWTEQSG